LWEELRERGHTRARIEATIQRLVERGVLELRHDESKWVMEIEPKRYFTTRQRWFAYLDEKRLLQEATMPEPGGLLSPLDSHPKQPRSGHTEAACSPTEPGVVTYRSDRGPTRGHHEPGRGETRVPIGLAESSINTAGPVEETTAPGPSEQAPPSSTANATHEFLEFPPKQRKLLATLRGQGSVAITDVKQAVYGTKSTATSTLERLLGRTNKNLTDRGYRLEIKRKVNMLSLQPV
jgi:hypothetical protein